MRRWRPGLTTVAVIAFVSIASLGFALARASAERFLHERLSGELEPERVQAVIDDFSRTFVVFAATGVLLGAVLTGLLGVHASRSVLGLRKDTLRRARGQRTPLARPAVSELNRLAGAIEMLASEGESRVGGLERERAEMALLVHSVSEGILLVGPGSRVMHANPAARALLTLPEDCHGQSLAALIRQGELRRVIEAATESDGTTAEVALNERRLLVVTRRVTTGEANGAASSDAIVVALVDLTQVRRLEGARRDFVANVSHELKTPLTSIRGYVETLLTDDPGTAVRDQFLHVIQRNAERLQYIVDDLLDLSRIESGGWMPAIEVFDPVRIIAETWEGFAQRSRERKITFAQAPPAGVFVRADPSALRHILTNLFDNALRHTGAGGTVTVAVRPPGKDAPYRVCIEVRDTGSGIPHDALPRIFERFYRADPARSRAEGGTGLGLSIVKHLTESMGGDVSASSALGNGTTFFIRLPAGPA